MSNKTSQVYVVEPVIARLCKICILCDEDFEISHPTSSELVCPKCKLMWKILQNDIFKKLEDNENQNNQDQTLDD